MFFLSPKKDINKGLKDYKSTQDAVLIDVRNPGECRHGVIPGSINLPLSKLKKATHLIPDMDTPIFAYCLSGARADKAVKRLKRMGYTDVRSIGGLTGYKGTLKKPIFR